MKKVLIATEKPFVRDAVNKIIKVFQKSSEQLDVRLLEEYKTHSELLEAVSDADALIVRSDRVDTGVFQAAGNLKGVISLHRRKQEHRLLKQIQKQE